MAKIVGKDDSVVKRVTCRNCASILEYVPCEVRENYSTDYTGDKDYYKYILCPCCGKQATVTSY